MNFLISKKTASTLTISAALLLSSLAHSAEPDYFELTDAEVREYGYQVGENWYALVKLPPRPSSIKGEAESHIVRIVGEIINRATEANESSENLIELDLYLNRKLPLQCAALRRINLLSDDKECINYIKMTANENQYLRTMAIMRFHGMPGMETLYINYIKKP